MRKRRRRGKGAEIALESDPIGIDGSTAQFRETAHSRSRRVQERG